MSAGNIKVELNYNRDNGIRPFKFGRPRTQKEQMIFHADEGGPRKFVPSLVRNARNGNFSLDKNSFELIKDQTSLSTNDFYNTQLIEKVYYKEVAESIKNATGASAVQIYHHQVNMNMIILWNQKSLSIRFAILRRIMDLQPMSTPLYKDMLIGFILILTLLGALKPSSISLMSLV